MAHQHRDHRKSKRALTLPRVVSAGAEVQVHPATLPLHLSHLALA
jgi:hypothetical protein